MIERHKTLITGAAGFVGKSLVRELINLNYEIYCMDIVELPSALEEYKEELNWIVGDFVGSSILAILEDVRPSVIIHLATTLFPNESKLNPVKDCFENVYKTICFFESAYKLGTERIIYASSAGTVYGENDGAVLNEDSSTYPMVSYGATKLCVEHFLRLLADKYNASSVSLRISNPYGEEQSLLGNQGVIPIFLNKIGNEEKIEVWGDLNSTRDYIYIDDLVEHIIACLSYRGRYREFNVCSGSSYSLNDIIAIIEEATSKKSIITYPKVSYSKPDHVRLDRTRAEKELGIIVTTVLQQKILKLSKYHGLNND